MLKVVADARCLQDNAYRERGVGRHATTILQRTRASLKDGAEVIAILDETLPDLTPSHHALFDGFATPARARAWRDAVFVGLSPMTHPQTLVAGLLTGERLTCAIVYDFIPKEYPERYLPTRHAKIVYHEALLWLRAYRLFFPISGHTADRLREQTGATPDRITVTGVGVSSELTAAARDTTLNTSPPSRFRPGEYFLTVAGGDDRKNVECPLTAHARLRRTGTTQTGFVVVGRYGPEQERSIKAAYRAAGGPPKALQFLADVSNRELAILYRGAVATICPSRAEGFSIPLVEAIACGCPVLASDCPAQEELLNDPDFLFRPDDHERVASLMRAAARPDERAAYLERQSDIPNRFSEELVAESFWRRITAELGHRRSAPASRRARPRIAFVTPYPPEESGVADYSRSCLLELGKLVDVDVFTNATTNDETAPIRRFAPISPLPYLGPRYDRVISVVGNSHLHFDIVNHLLDYGGACVSHDFRMLEFYRARLPAKAFTAFASQSLGRAVSLDEVESWVQDLHRLPTLFFDELLPASDPFITHSRITQRRIREQYGANAEYLPFCAYRNVPAHALTPQGRIRARDRLGVDAGTFLVAVMGSVYPQKAPVECVWALEHLHAWGVDARLVFVGFAPREVRSALERLAGTLGLAEHVLITGRVREQVYLDYLVSADAAIQVRAYAGGGLSGTLLDCLQAGLPTVVNAGIAEAMEAEAIVASVPDQLSPTLIAEQLLAMTSERGERRIDDAVRDYLSTRNFGVYAKELLQILELET